MVDRLDFEELALKSIDLSASPSVDHLGSESKVSESEKASLSVCTVPFRINHVR
jgi:hypothetical protein